MGLGTRDVEDAEQMVEELNQILADRTLWDIGARPTAQKRFDERVVEIFYRDIVPEVTDFFAIRESIIPLPTSTTSDYRQVLLVGTTGGGKTTLVRQLIGTDPVTERFPSTSTAKTTVADTEIVLADGPYRAAVTFLPRDEVRDYIEQCVSAAVLTAFSDGSDDEIRRRLLNHVNQRFRASYILGTGGLAAAGDDKDDDEYDDVANVENEPTPELTVTDTLLHGAILRVRAIANSCASHLRAELYQSDSDNRVIAEIFEESVDELLAEDADCEDLVDQLIDEITKRFDFITHGKFERNKQGWPSHWIWETDDRQSFLKGVSRYSSNYAPYFGTLLTPLVNGIRVSGPFVPTWGDTDYRLVLLDGEGLGHTADSTSSLPTATTRRIDEADAVILVDSATQPMQAAPLAVMKGLVSSGRSSKLLFCFTHFDAVGGDNLRGFQAREEHVIASAENMISKIGQDLGPVAERALRARLQGGRFFVGGIDKVLDPSKKAGSRTIEQLRELLRALDNIVQRPELGEARPVYDRLNLVLAVRKATENFHEAWLARLGKDVNPNIPKEHWARIKALSRRVAEGWDNGEYDTLRPVADLYTELTGKIYGSIQTPLRWTATVPADDVQLAVFEAFAGKISTSLLDLCARKIRDEKQGEWQSAYYERGNGSTYRRATIIARDIYGQAAPIPDSTPSPDQNVFLHEVLRVVEAIADELEVVLI
jgi:hypothetical protein